MYMYMYMYMYIYISMHGLHLVFCIPFYLVQAG